MIDPQNASVYIVAGREESRVNDRVTKLLSLRDRFHAVTLVTPGSRTSDKARLKVPPTIGITGLLRVLRLSKLKESMDRYLYFPSLDIRFVWAIKHPLSKRLDADINAGLVPIVVLTFPPHALGLIALRIKKKHPSVRVILDWQDLWSFDPNYAERSPNLYKKRIRRWEENFIATADFHLTTNERAAMVLVNQYNAPADRVGYIEHHFHPNDLISEGREPVSTTQYGPIKLAFMGTLDKPPRVPGLELLDVVREVNSRRRLVELHVYGSIPDMTKEERQLATDSGIVFHGLVTHEKATRALVNYDVLVILLADMPNSRVVLSIKLPHYLLAEKPILAITPGDSAIADVIESTGAGLVIDTSSSATKSWHSKLSEILSDKNRLTNLDCNRSQSAIDTYHWENIAPRWVDVLTGAQKMGNKE